MTRLIPAAVAALMTTSAAACAQDFNNAPPNAPDQQPAFEAQTRAPALPDDIPLKTERVAQGLEHPWGMDQLPDGSWLVTERPGRLRVVRPDGTLSEPITGLPRIDARGQGGLLDVLAAPDFADSRRIWFSYAAPAEGGKNQTAVATATLNADMTALEGVQEIFRQQPAWASDKHFGSRLVMDPEGMLFITLGERSDPAPRATAQDDGNHIGKLVRVSPSGEPAGAGIDGWLPETWAKGFRNVQAAALDPQGRLWTVEHGPKGGDELNRPEVGRNYGWPVITYGLDYSGAPIGEGLTAQEGMEQPLYYWDPVIAPSGMVFYDGGMFPEWKGQALVGGLRPATLARTGEASSISLL
ncbi:MAG TPA: PQQ-dependent sugar dehydrogenase, partial [Paracoccus sp. (in: a-proteobacteria)]|nr:PQQ-dependent sugar dehydrogenase [Paracoccus sp. (in: a-proteobacteria)]